MAGGESPPAFFIMPNPLDNTNFGRWHGNSFGQNDMGQYTENYIQNSGASAFTQGVFGDWLYPASKEARQLLMQQYQQLVEPSIRMQGMIDAGINPLTAAAGIAGSSAGNIPSPSSSTNPIGDIAGAVGSVAGGVGSLANAYKSIEEGKQVEKLASSTIQKNDAEIDKWSHENNFTDTQNEAMQIDNQTRDANNKADLLVKIANYKLMKRQAAYIQSQKKYVDKQVAWYDRSIEAEIELDKKRALEAEKHAFLMGEQKRTEQLENDFIDAYGYKRGQPFDSAMLDLWFQGRFDDVQKAQEFMYNHKYKSARAEEEGRQESVAKFAYQIANAQETAKSLNQIITDWNQPASGLWSLIEKSFNVSGNKKGKNNIGNAISAKENPDIWASYAQFVVGLQISLESINEELSAASAANDFVKIREISKQRDGLQKFIQELTFEQYKQHMEAK